MSNQFDKHDLVDIRSISIDRNLSKEERTAEYLRQIKDPYHFKCGSFIVTARFSSDGNTIEDCLRSLLA